MRIHARITLITFLVTSLFLVGATLVWNQSLQQERRENLDLRLLSEARILVGLLPDRAPFDPERIADLVDAVHRETRTRITLIDSSGVVLAESELPPAGIARMENHINRPEVQAALRDGIGRNTRLSPTLGLPMAYLGIRWGPSVRPLGVLRVALPETRVLEEERRGRGRLVVVVLVTGILSAIAGWFGARRITAPINELSRSARELASGRSDIRLSSGGPPEVRNLADALNYLNDSVQAQVSAVEVERRRLARLFDGMPDGMLALDADGRIRLANHAARHLLSLKEKAVGQFPLEAVRSPELSGAIEKARHRDEVSGVALTHAGRDLEITLVPLEAGMICVIHDVSRLKQLQIARRDMVANIGHELRTPLASILGYLETLEHGEDLAPEERDRFLGVIRRNARRLERLVQELGTLSSLESDTPSRKKTVQPARPLIENAFETLADRAGKRQVHFALELEPGLDTVCGDPVALDTIFLNLLDNALRVAPPDSTVRVRGGLGEDVVWFEVADEGPGIPAPQRERVLERFYRLDPGRATTEGGLGLGLAIVKHAVQRHGGLVEILDAEPHGARIRFTLETDPGAS